MNPVIRTLVLVLAAGGLVATGAAVIQHTPVAAAQERGDDGGEGWLGVSLQDMDADLRDALDLEGDAAGAVVGRVVPDSPADEAGIRRLDIIVKIGAHDVADVDDAIDRIRDYGEGDEVEVTVLRRGQQRTYVVELGAREDARLGVTPRALRRGGPGVAVIPEGDRRGRGEGMRWHHFFRGEEGGFLGVESMEMNEQLAGYFGAGDGGVLVTRVVEDSPAEEAGLAAGDVIVSVAGREVDTDQRLRRAVRRYDPQEDVEVVVLRRGERRTFTVKLGDVRDFGGRFEVAPDVFGFDPDIDFDLDGRSAPRIYRFDQEDWGRHLREMRESLREIREEVRREVQGEIRHELRHEVREGMEEARKALEEARREVQRALSESYYD